MSPAVGAQPKWPGEPTLDHVAGRAGSLPPGTAPLCSAPSPGAASSPGRVSPLFAPVEFSIEPPPKRQIGSKRCASLGAVRDRRISAVTAAAVAGMLIAGAGLPGAASGYTVKTRRIGPGVKYTRIHDPKGPWRIKIVSVKLARDSTLDVALAQDELPGFERTSSMASRHGAIAAVNGDYALPSGRPVFDFAADGRVAQTALSWGRNFAVDVAETAAHIGHPRMRIRVFSSELFDVAVDRVNDRTPFRADPPLEEVVAFTPAGGSIERPPLRSCAARLRPVGAPRPAFDGHATEIDHVVEKVRCSYKRLAHKGGIIVAAPRASGRAAEVASLVPGLAATLSWRVKWPGVFDTIGGNPTLIEDGVVVEGNVSGGSSFFDRHPRTGVGTTADGRVLLVTVDGRRPRWSVGMTLEELADLFSSLGVTWALNLDGGGSTTMFVRGEVVNRPSDGSERAVSSALLVLRGADQGEPEPAEAAGPSPGLGLLADPGSTGGLAQAASAAGMRLVPGLEAARRAVFDP